MQSPLEFLCSLTKGNTAVTFVVTRGSLANHVTVLRIDGPGMRFSPKDCRQIAEILTNEVSVRNIGDVLLSDITADVQWPSVTAEQVREALLVLERA
jgi:hypothetical protein